jgi:molybdopterin-guanine dinucleotide biosynthesis protein
VSPDTQRDRRAVVTVSASSKKAGKSAVASYLVGRLGARYGLKVSAGTHTRESVVSDRDTVSRPGTDTGSLVEAGAERVLWANASPERLGSAIQKALSMFGDEGIIVVEGNSALEHIKADVKVFIMNVPFGDFKPSAATALARSDFILVDMRWQLTEEDPRTIAGVLARKAPGARATFFYDDISYDAALDECGAFVEGRLRHRK